ncbi:hypothetical protein [Ostreibacterium oceani]|uniref:Lipoprotein n=1 Tax=Ostreibacterium oceani TaxID=2654998 RepID=A0A6N7EYP9_9GAMM|nr:hypothetical protein [Ostreibacterium oceani]MPV86680.1 hypothetical protein [Ostreibacterium oceani]
MKPTTIHYAFVATALTLIGCSTNYTGKYFTDGAPETVCSSTENCQQILGDFNVNYDITPISKNQYMLNGTSEFSFEETSSIYQNMQTMTLVFILLSGDEIVCQFNASISGDMSRQKTLKEKFTCEKPFDSSMLIKSHGYITE